MKSQIQCKPISQFRCLWFKPAYSRHPIRFLSSKVNSHQVAENLSQENSRRTNETPSKEDGAMTRRMKEMSEEAMLGGKSAIKNMREAGFSDELKRQLEERIAASSFKNEHSQAFSIVNMPRSAGKGTHDIASAAPWMGVETTHDTALRMLNDSKKPLKVPFKAPALSSVNLQPRGKTAQSSVKRLAQARDSKNTYELSQDSRISESEREAYRRELQDRFTPGARAFPMSLQGLSSLANERIEDAIAKGQFRNIPRGKGKNVERDHVANSPYLDTTEYFMNRIMQKQEVTPEWIQKQQELKLETHRFRTQLRADWKRHAARLISSQGGTLEMQIRRAQAYAAAEARHNKHARVPTQEKTITDVEKMSQIDQEGRLYGTSCAPDLSDAPSSAPRATLVTKDSENEPGSLPDLPCLRDPQYLTVENEYHVLKIKKLNELVRSYNLLAPRIAQRPYLNLQRELDSCYAAVAPSLAEEVQRRATQRSHNTATLPEQNEGAGPLQKALGLGQAVRVHDEDTSKGYGLKQFWRDFWSRGTAPS